MFDFYKILRDIPKYDLLILCMFPDVIVSLANEISKIGSRSSTSLNIDSKYYYHDLLYLVDLDCPSSEDIIALVSLVSCIENGWRTMLYVQAVRLHLVLCLPLPASTSHIFKFVGVALWSSVCGFSVQDTSAPLTIDYQFYIYLYF